MYLRDKNGRVAQPDPAQSEDSLIFAPGVEVILLPSDEAINRCHCGHVVSSVCA